MASSSHDFDLYKLLNERVQKEIDELYQIQTTHTTAVAALLAACGFAKENYFVLLACGIAGAIVCLTWWLGYKGQEEWKLWWTTELAKVECRLEDVCIWRKVIFLERKDDDDLMKLLGKPMTVEDTPPRMKVVDAFARFRPILFGVVFIAIASYGAMQQIAQKTPASAAGTLPGAASLPAESPPT